MLARLKFFKKKCLQSQKIDYLCNVFDAAETMNAIMLKNIYKAPNKRHLVGCFSFRKEFKMYGLIKITDDLFILGKFEQQKEGYKCVSRVWRIENDKISRSSVYFDEIIHREVIPIDDGLYSEMFEEMSKIMDKIEDMNEMANYLYDKKTI